MHPERRVSRAHADLGERDIYARVVLGLALVGAGMYLLEEWSVLSMVLSLTGLILLMTVAFGWCPLYEGRLLMRRGNGMRDRRATAHPAPSGHHRKAA